MNELALFAGAGGGILGGQLLGWRTVCAVEIDPYCRSVLLARQRDGMLPVFPIWDDVRTFSGVPWRGHIDVISGGFPCQDISSAGKGAGLSGEKSGLWREFARIIGEVRPTHVFIENSPYLRTRGLVTVLKDLAERGYNARWGVLGASDVGAPHIRKRLWIVAHANDGRQRNVSEYAETARASKVNGDVKDAPNAASLGRRPRREGRFAPSVSGESKQTLHPPNSDSTALRIKQGRSGRAKREGSAESRKTTWWPVDLVSGVDDGVAHRVDRVRATGNGQVPGVAALAWETLK